jgi:hypothetical protein
MINWVKSKLKKKSKFSNYPDLRIKYAFTSGGIDNYEFEDPNMLTSGRGFAALNYYKEVTMGCTREYLIAHAELVESILTNPKSINIFEIRKLNAQLKERLTLAIDSLTPYKLLAVMTFDETEDPYSFDYAYALKKIERWKKDEDATFFLRIPQLKNLIPSSLLSEENIQNYMRVAQEVDKMDYQSILESTSQLLSESQKSSDWLKVLKSEKNII